MGAIIILLLLLLRHEGIIHYKEALALLKGALAMAESARDNRKETVIAAKVIEQKLEAVPEQTAAKVVERQKSSGDDWRAHDRPT